MSFSPLVLISAGLLLAVVARPEVKCPVPVSPLNGQLFATASGSSVKYTCNPGFELKGAQIAICKGDQWFPEAPTCEPLSAEKQNADEMQTATTTTPEPLFKSGDDESEASGKTKVNDTMQSDTPNVVYVRRPVSASWPYYYRASMHVVDENGQVNDEALRQYYYYWASQYPRSALLDYRTGHQLSESQWAWINSLHPEVRDQYLKDLYGLREDEVNFLTYPNGYYYTRQPVAVVAESPVSALDYSCHRTERDGTIISIKAPKLANAYVHRYDRRQNRNHPYNDYLAAEYRCKAGYRLLDPRHSEMYCSQSSWVGNPPVCV